MNTLKINTYQQKQNDSFENIDPSIKTDVINYIYDKLDLSDYKFSIIKNTADIFYLKNSKNLCKKKNLEVVEYTVAPVFMDGKEKGRHQWLIEFKKPPSNMQEISSLIDELLKSENSDYEAKRYNNISLEKPEIIIGKKGVFYKWMKKRKKLGGQNKIPRLSNSREYIEELLKINT